MFTATTIYNFNIEKGVASSLKTPAVYSTCFQKLKEVHKNQHLRTPVVIPVDTPVFILETPVVIPV